VSPTPDDCFHLSIEIVRQVHAEAIKTFGGLDGIRDENPHTSISSMLRRHIFSIFAVITHLLMETSEPPWAQRLFSFV
jgi:hypothetical protein